MYHREYRELQTANTILSIKLKNCQARNKFLKNSLGSHDFGNALLKKQYEADHTHIIELKKKVEHL